VVLFKEKHSKPISYCTLSWLFTFAAGLIMLSPAVYGPVALAFSKQQKKKHERLYYGTKFLLLK